MIFENDFKLKIKSEDELILNVVRNSINPENKSHIHSLLQKKIDWDYIIQNTYDYGLLALFYKQINSLYPDLIPEDVMKILNDFFHENENKNLILKNELLKILKILKSNGIEAIPYNGLILAINSYPDQSLRQSDNIDIFINELDVPKVNEILISKGYSILHQDIDEDFYIKTQNEYILFDKDDNVKINIHWNFNGFLFSFPKDPVDIFKKDKLVPLEINSVNILSFSPENQLLIQSVYNANQGWIRLICIYDLVVLIQNNEINWNKIMDNAKLLGFQRILLINIFLAKVLFGLEIPEEIEDYIDLDDKIRDISMKIVKKMFFEFGYPIKIFESAMLNFNMRENIIDGVKDNLRSLIRPSYVELREISLPKILNPFYYFIRPFYLLKRHGIGPLKGYETSEFEPTPYEVIKRMFSLVELDKDDIIYDLGCGDGRIIINACKEYGAQGFGVDIDPNLIKECKFNAAKEGVDNLATFIKQDASETDISKATVVFIYLYYSFIQNKLCPKFKNELSPGTKIVSHRYKIANWKPLKTEIVVHKNQLIPLYLWMI